MKSSLALRLAAFCLVAVAVCPVWSAEKDEKSIAAEIKFETLVRITPRPMRLRPDVRALCAPPNAKNDHGILVKDRDAIAHVFVSPDAVDSMLKRDAVTFPVGSVVLKQKLEADKGQNVILYTGMLKRGQGYNPDCGDWEFFTLSADGKTVTSQGRLESCMACHKDYARSDYLTKQYPIER